jgi:hypothetical protein
MSVSIDKVLGADEETFKFLLVGNCDVVIQGLVSGSVTLQYRLPPTANYTSPQWVNFPNGVFTSDVYKTVFISEHGVMCKLVGNGNNAGVYARLARYLNK